MDLFDHYFAAALVAVYAENAGAGELGATWKHVDGARYARKLAEAALAEREAHFAELAAKKGA